MLNTHTCVIRTFRQLKAYFATPILNGSELMGGAIACPVISIFVKFQVDIKRVNRGLASSALSEYLHPHQDSSRSRILRISTEVEFADMEVFTISSEWTTDSFWDPKPSQARKLGKSSRSYSNAIN